jgi:hypothetical protein
MIIVLVNIRKRFCQRCCLWMGQGKGILIGFSILSVKVISGEMTGLLESMSYYQEGLMNLCLINL